LTTKENVFLRRRLLGQQTTQGRNFQKRFRCLRGLLISCMFHWIEKFREHESVHCLIRKTWRTRTLIGGRVVGKKKYWCCCTPRTLFEAHLKKT